MENSRHIDYNINVLRFVLDHKITPEKVQVARAIVEGNLQAIDNCVKQGLLTDKRFNEIIQDQELQGEYAQMVEALHKGYTESFELLYNDIIKTPDTFCGWLDYYNQYLVNYINVDLFGQPNSDYLFGDFCGYA